MVGRPVMTANEGRARLNLPALRDADADTLAPQQGGPATAPTPTYDDTTAAAPLPTIEAHALPLAEQVARLEQEAWQRAEARLRKVAPEERAAALNVARCTRELTQDLWPYLGADASAQAYATVTGWAARLRPTEQPGIATPASAPNTLLLATGHRIALRGRQEGP